MNSRPLPYQGSALPLSYTGVVGAEDEVRTRDPQLGRLMLYRLSYFRIFQSKSPIVLVRAFCGRRWIRTTEGINQQIYSLPHLATLVFSLFSFLVGDFFVELRIFGRSLPRGNSLLLRSLASKSLKNKLRKPFRVLSRWRESNPRPRDYKSRALAN